MPEKLAPGSNALPDLPDPSTAWRREEVTARSVSRVPDSGAPTDHEIASQMPIAFWHDRYRRASGTTGGRPTRTLERFAAEHAPGVALDLGYSRNDDAVWRARRRTCAIITVVIAWQMEIAG